MCNEPFRSLAEGGGVFAVESGDRSQCPTSLPRRPAPIPQRLGGGVARTPWEWEEFTIAVHTLTGTSAPTLDSRRSAVNVSVSLGTLSGIPSSGESPM